MRDEGKEIWYFKKGILLTVPFIVEKNIMKIVNSLD